MSLNFFLYNYIKNEDQKEVYVLISYYILWSRTCSAPTVTF